MTFTVSRRSLAGIVLLGAVAAGPVAHVGLSWTASPTPADLGHGHLPAPSAPLTAPLMPAGVTVSPTPPAGPNKNTIWG